VDTVRGVNGAIGFGPYSRPLEDGLRVLRVDGRNPTDADYPSSVVLALIYLSGVSDPAALAFLRFVDSPAAQAIIASLGSVPAKQKRAGEIAGGWCA